MAVSSRPAPASVLLSTLLFLIFCVDASSAASVERRFTQIRYIMGTLCEVTVFAADEESADKSIRAAFDELQRLDLLMSNYREDSELSRVNREAGKCAVEADPELLSVINLSLKYSRLSGGAFDITAGPLMRAWGFFGSDKMVPSDEELSRAKAAVGYQKVKVDTASQTIEFSTPEVELDLGAIGKGYAVDKAIDVLKKSGISRAVVNAGGNLCVIGELPVEESSVGIQHPRKDGLLATIRLKDMAVASSGDYEKFFVADGKRYSHIMDPRTGKPVAETVATTVVSITAVEADALSTAVYVLGPRDGVRLVESLPGAECLIVYQSADGGLKTVESGGWEKLIGVN